MTWKRFSTGRTDDMVPLGRTWVLLLLILFGGELVAEGVVSACSRLARIPRRLCRPHCVAAIIAANVWQHLCKRKTRKPSETPKYTEEYLRHDANNPMTTQTVCIRRLLAVSGRCAWSSIQCVNNDAATRDPATFVAAVFLNRTSKTAKERCTPIAHAAQRQAPGADHVIMAARGTPRLTSARSFVAVVTRPSRHAKALWLSCASCSCTSKHYGNKGIGKLTASRTPHHSRVCIGQ